MGIRESLNKNPAITTGITVGIIVVALGFIIYSSVGSGGPKIPTKGYYTVDDGKTYFSDDINKVPPYQSSKGEAVRAHVFACKDGKPFVAYLERMTPEAKKQIEAFNAKSEEEKMKNPDAINMISERGTEYKKPGGPKWVKASDYARSAEVTMINCPEGNNKSLEMVLP